MSKNGDTYIFNTTTVKDNNEISAHGYVDIDKYFKNYGSDYLRHDWDGSYEKLIRDANGIVIKTEDSDGDSRNANIANNRLTITSGDGFETYTISNDKIMKHSVNDKTSIAFATELFDYDHTLVYSPLDFYIKENVLNTFLIGAIDDDNDTLTYTLSGADAGLFKMSSGGPSLKTVLDYEKPTDVGADNVYNVTVNASDGRGGTDARDLIIKVTDVSETPTPEPTPSGSQRIKNIQEADGTIIEAFEYDANGNIVKQKAWNVLSEKDETTIFKYDTLGHVVSANIDRENDGIFDDRTDFTTDANGNLLTMKNYKISTDALKDESVRAYDSHGNILTTTQTNYGDNKAVTGKVETTYENTYNGEILTQFSTVSKIEGSISHIGDLTMKYKYNADGLISEEDILSGPDHYIDKIFYENGAISKVEFDTNADSKTDSTSIYNHEAGAYSTVYQEFFDPFYVFK